MVRKKLVKKLVAIVCTTAMCFMSFASLNVKAETKNWSSSKIPGSYTTGSTSCTFTYYAGTYYFKATTLTSDAAYNVGVCENFLINTGTGNVKVSKINTPVSFKVKQPAIGSGLNTTIFKIYIDHNATQYQNAYGSGTIYHN